MANPAVPACLSTRYSSKPDQRGGTIIAEDVVDLDAHRSWMEFINFYRPDRCESCLGERLHGHGRRNRELVMGGGWSITELVRRYRCVGCGGIWLVLPAVIARHLHRTWDVVQSVAVRAKALATPSQGLGRDVPRRTIARWLGRLALSAWMLVQALAVTNVHDGVESGTCSRAEYVDALAASGAVAPRQKLAQVAEWVHRVVPGFRLM